MSYSFSVVADTKDEAGVKIEAELAKVVEGQPTHEADRQAAQDAAEAIIDVLDDPGENECVNVYVAGSLGWRSENHFISANVNISASLSTKPS